MVSQTDLRLLLKKILNTCKDNPMHFELLCCTVIFPHLNSHSVDVTMALLYSFNPCQAWALRKSALVFTWSSSRACETEIQEIK